MIPEKRIIRRIQSGGCAIHCQDCSISQLCIPFTLNEHELDQLDNIIERKKPIQKGQTLFKAGDELKSLYAIRSGTIKSYTITEQGDEQITGGSKGANGVVLITTKHGKAGKVNIDAKVETSYNTRTMPLSSQTSRPIRKHA